MRRTVNKSRSQGTNRARRLTTTKRRPRPLGSNQGVADSVRTTLAYSDVEAIHPGATVGQYTFRSNSCFDPDYMSGGHQPQYYGQMSAINEQVGSALQITVIPSSDITAFTTSTYPLEHPYATPMRLLGVGGLMSGTVSTAMATACSQGLHPREILDQDYSATTRSNPSSIWYSQMAAQDSAAENVTTSVDLATQATIKYDVEFYDRNLTSPSVTLKDPETIPETISREQRQQQAYGITTSGVDKQRIYINNSDDRPVVYAHVSRGPVPRSWVPPLPAKRSGGALEC